MPPPGLVSIQVGTPSARGREGAQDPADRTWSTGFFKSPVAGPVFLGATNLDGDGQADLVNHGGADKTVCAYPADHYPDWRRELDRPDLPFGAFGENFTLQAVTEADVCIGDTWRVGGAVVQVSQPRQPCWKLARRWGIKDLPARVIANGRTGWYFRVLNEGSVAPGQPLTLIDRPHEIWTIDRANRVMHHNHSDPDSAAELAALPELSSSWRSTLAARLVK